ncbi:hypothetical protein RND81_05G109400 [Saponaria officinalis]|uniref:Uncharacterized protein n=1 Tax=Saponaria officinalis TaxID=3572 RepID=A0AAW1KW92_SAPOF
MYVPSLNNINSFLIVFFFILGDDSCWRLKVTFIYVIFINFLGIYGIASFRHSEDPYFCLPANDLVNVIAPSCTHATGFGRRVIGSSKIFWN